MKKINVLRICYWCLLIIAGFIIAVIFPECNFKHFVSLLAIMMCCIAAGYIDRIIDEYYGNN